MRFRGHLFALAMLTAVAGGTVKAVVLRDAALTWRAVILVIIGLAAATALTYGADVVIQRLWIPTRDTIHAVVTRKEALSGAMAMSTMMWVYGWTGDALSGRPVYLSLLWVDALFIALAAAAFFALYHHLATR